VKGGKKKKRKGREGKRKNEEIRIMHAGF